MSNKHKRIEQLRSMLKVEKSMKISEISNRIGVSPMTTRRDIEILEREGFIKVLHGAVIYNTIDTGGGLSDYMLTIAEGLNKEKKKKIAQYSLSLIEDDDIIFLDAGSTTESFARLLPLDIKLTVICYTINIFLAVADHKNITTILLGGTYNRETMILEQQGISPILQNNRTRKAFISASGFHSRLGLTCSNESESLTKKTAVQLAAESYLLMDSSKFDNVHSCFFAEATDFDHIITNDDLNEPNRKFLSDTGVTVHYV
ncbi:MAG: DeoR/GlpR transcriptional regulator [Spirochaetales bacterium]|nr:DeoR/GlpR transcriptional regulator [Spirochaetales bacterium]